MKKLRAILVAISVMMLMIVPVLYHYHSNGHNNILRQVQEPATSTPVFSHHITLPAAATTSISKFLLFVGYARSGHSIIGSILDAHPHVIIAHEYSLISQWLTDPLLHSNKTWLYNVLYENSYFSSNTNGTRMRSLSRKGYSLIVDNLWQGSYNRNIIVIGDKAGGKTTNTYLRNKTGVHKVITELRETVKVPIVAIHAVRNPFDNIATMVLRKSHLYNQYHGSNSSVYDDIDVLNARANAYFKRVSAVVEMTQQLNISVITVHNDDLIHHPARTISHLCSNLSITCTKEYLAQCSSAVYVTSFHSRHKIQWTARLIDFVHEKSKQFSFLQRYKFDN